MAVTDVSASIDSFKGFDPVYGIVGIDPEYLELSLVSDGAYTGNSIEVVQ